MLLSEKCMAKSSFHFLLPAPHIGCLSLINSGSNMNVHPKAVDLLSDSDDDDDDGHQFDTEFRCMHCAKSYRPFELFVNENYKL